MRVDASRVGSEDLYESDRWKTDCNCSLVFSAPRYCDATENKGAYINIGSDLKLQFQKFSAVPHPNIKPMVCINFRDPSCFVFFSLYSVLPRLK